MSKKTHYDVEHQPYSRHTRAHRLPDQMERPTVPRHATLRKGLQSLGLHTEEQHPPHQAQAQAQGQLQRSLEASKQMLYGTFGNVLATLEEYEQREIMEKGTCRPNSFRRSNIKICDQSRKTKEDLKSNVETQLLLFETQSNVCPPEVKAALLEELKKKTLGWAAVRAEMGLPENQDTDRYIAKLYEILSTGRTNHKKPSLRDLNEGVMRDDFQAMLYGDHDREMLDQSFKKNPDKKATGPDTRHSEMFDEAARRISRARGKRDLDDSLQQDVRRFQEYGPRDLK